MAPLSSLPAALSSFITQFYHLSDTPSAHEAYADSFVSSPHLLGFQIGGAPASPATDRAGILAWRHAAWEAVAKRRHTVHGVYPAGGQAGNGAEELMLYGEVEYLKKDGSEASASWAGRMVFDTQSLEKGEPKMKEYTVWVTPRPAKN